MNDSPSYRPIITFDPSKTNICAPSITASRSLKACTLCPGGVYRAIPSNIPRLCYDLKTTNCNGILVEAEATNLVLNSDLVGGDHWSMYLAHKVIYETTNRSMRKTPIYGFNRTNPYGSIINDVENVPKGTYTFSLVTTGLTPYTDNCSFGIAFNTTVSTELTVNVDFKTRQAELITELSNCRITDHTDLGGGFFFTAVSFEITSDVKVLKVYLYPGINTNKVQPTSPIFFDMLQLEAAGAPSSWVIPVGNVNFRPADKINLPVPIGKGFLEAYTLIIDAGFIDDTYSKERTLCSIQLTDSTQMAVACTGDQLYVKHIDSGGTVTESLKMTSPKQLTGVKLAYSFNRSTHELVTGFSTMSGDMPLSSAAIFTIGVGTSTISPPLHGHIKMLSLYAGSIDSASLSVFVN